MLNNLNIRNKLALVMSIFAGLLVSLLYIFYYYQAKQELVNRTFQHLSSVKELKQFQIESELKSLQKEFLFDFEDLPKVYLKNKGVIHYAVQDSNSFAYSHYSINNLSLSDTGTFVIDLTVQNPKGKITLGLVKKKADDYCVAIVQPNMQRVLLERTGLGVSGESYLVGAEQKMLSQSRFFPDKIATSISVNSVGVNAGLSNKSGFGIIHDYRNKKVFSVYSPINVSLINWVILTEIDEEEALMPLVHLNNNFLVILGCVLVVIFIVSYNLSTKLTHPILQVADYLKEMSKGIYTSNLSLETRKDEIGQLYTSLTKLVSAIENAIVFADAIGKGKTESSYLLTSKQDRLGVALINMKERLQEYRHKEIRLEQKNRESIIAGEEKERKRLFREIHDGIGPLITLLQLKIEGLAIQGENKNELQTLISNLLDELRRVSYNLTPSVLTDFGAGEAIRNLLSLISTTKLNINYVYDNNNEVTIPPDISVILFRVVQEATNNTLKYAKASELDISLTEFTDKVSLYIKDNGQGFNPDAITYGSGIHNMRERVTIKNGTFVINTSPEGTEIEVELPLQ